MLIVNKHCVIFKTSFKRTHSINLILGRNRGLDRFVRSWVKKPRVGAKIEFRYESFKRKFINLFDYNLIIGTLKRIEKIVRESCF